MVFQAPLGEFARAIERVSHMIAPLRVRTMTAQRITLGATEAARRTSLPPPPIEISARESLPAPPEPAHTSRDVERSAPELLRAIARAPPRRRTSTRDGTIERIVRRARWRR